MGLFTRFKKKEKSPKKQAEKPVSSQTGKTRSAQAPDDLQMAIALLQFENDPMLTSMKKKELLGGIKDEGALYLIAMEAKDPDLRWEAAGRMNDAERLTTFALQMPPVGPWKIMERICKAPDRAERLRKIRKEAREEAVRTAALQYLAELENTPELCLEYAKAAHTKNPLYRIKDAEFLSKAILEDEDPFIRNSIAEISYNIIPGPILLEFALRTDNDFKTRAYIVNYLLTVPELEDPEGKLEKILPEFMDKYDPIIFSMAGNGDPRAVPRLAELAKVHSFSMTAPAALGNIHTKESVQVLLELMQTDQVAGKTAAESLIRIYKDTGDPELKKTIAGIERKTYFEHYDIGESGRSCHSDTPAVVFDLEEE